MLCGFGMQQRTNLLHPWCVAVWVCNNAQIQKTTFFELGVCVCVCVCVCVYVYIYIYIQNYLFKMPCTMTFPFPIHQLILAFHFLFLGCDPST